MRNKSSGKGAVFICDLGAWPEYEGNAGGDRKHGRWGRASVLSSRRVEYSEVLYSGSGSCCLAMLQYQHKIQETGKGRYG